MLGPLLIFGVTYLLIISERVDRTAAAVIGAAAMILFRFMPSEAAFECVDLDVVFLLTGMMIVVGILSETGLFEWVAIFIAQRARGNAVAILVGLLTATAVLSAFLDNVTTVVLVAPITILVTQILEVPSVPYLVLLALFSNIGGTATLIGDPPNILIAAKSGLNFNQFIAHLSPAVILVGAAVLAPIAWFARKPLATPPEARVRIMQAHPELAIVQPERLRRGLVVFGGIIAGFIMGHALHVPPGVVALAGGFVMLIVCRVGIREAMEKVEWDTIFFLIGLFMLVGALEHAGLFNSIGGAIFRAIGHNLFLLCIAVLWVAGLLSAFFGNIPIVMAFIPLVNTMISLYFEPQGGMDSFPPEAVRLVADPLWWSLALGACLGGNGTLFGAAANVVVAQIAKKNGVPFSFTTFLRYSMPVTLASMLLSSGYVYIRYIAFVQVP